MYKTNNINIIFIINQVFSSLKNKIAYFVSRFDCWYQNNRFFNHFKKIVPIQNSLSILITAVFFIISLIIPNNKLFFALTAIYIFSQFIITKSFFITLTYVFIPISIYSIGLTYNFIAVPKTIIVSENYPEGRILNLIFSPYLVLLISSIGLFLVSLINKRNQIFNLEKIFLLSTTLLIIISSSQSIYFPLYSIIFASYWLGSTCLAFFIINNFQSLKNRNKKEILITLFFHVSLTILFISIITFFQLIKRAPLGLTIESTSIAPSFGSGADESNLIFRPVGLAPHANMMANELLIIWLTLLTVYTSLFKNYKFKKIINKFLFITTFFFLLTIIFSQSRAVYIAVITFCSLFFITNYDLAIKIIKFFLLKLKKISIIGFLLLLVIGFIFLQRALNSLNSFNETGGFPIRERLNQEAIDLFEKYPVLGVGFGMFIPAMAKNNPTGVISEFPEAVHNGFLLFIVENGLLAQTSIMIFFFLVIKRISNNKIYLTKKITLISFIVQFIPMFFHPFVNYLTVYTIVFLIIMNQKGTKTIE